MNKFVLGRPFCKIKRDIKIYIVVMVQLIIAFGILNIFLSLLLDIYENKKQLTETDVKYQIEIQDRNFDYLKFDLIAWGDTPVELNAQGKFPFSLQTIEQINSQCLNCKLSVAVTIELLYLGDLLNEGERLLVCYSSDDTKVRCSKRVEEVLEDISDQNTINAKDFPHTINGNRLTTIEGKEYDIEYTSDDELMIYMPIEVYYNLYHPKDLRGTMLSVKADSQQVTSRELNIIVSQLREIYSEEYQFGIKSELAHYLDQTEEAEREAKVFIFISLVIVVIVLIGMIGIFIMIVNRRKKEIAISCALGQIKDQIIFEMFAEISVLNVSAYLVGMLISCLIMQNGISVATIVFTYHNWSGIILFAVSMFLAGISIIPVRHLVRKMSPIDILSSL